MGPRQYPFVMYGQVHRLTGMIPERAAVRGSLGVPDAGHLAFGNFDDFVFRKDCASTATQVATTLSTLAIEPSNANNVLQLGFSGLNQTDTNTTTETAVRGMDVEFYGTSTTPLKWDASAEGLNSGGTLAIVGDGTTSFLSLFDVNGGTVTASSTSVGLKIGGIRVVGPQQAHIADPATDTGALQSAITSILVALETHGLLATS